LVALHRFASLNSVDALLSLVRSGLVIAALMLGHGLIALAVINLGMGLLRFVIVAVLLHRVYPELFVSLRLVTRGSIRMIFSFSVYSFLIQIGANLIYYTDTVIIGTALPVSMITFYAIGGSLIEYAISLVAGISQPMAPLASSIEARGDAEGLRRLVLKSSPGSREKCWQCWRWRSRWLQRIARLARSWPESAAISPWYHCC
jgi:O-antigen/teichoic acid export membrane protein